LSHRGDLRMATPGWFGHGLLTRPSSATAVSDRRRVTWRPTVGGTAGSGDPRRTIQIRNESSRDQRAVKTNFAACHGRTDYPRPRILSMHGENAMIDPSASQSIYLDLQCFSRLRDDSRVSRFRGLNSWVLHLAEADLEGRDRVDIIRQRRNPIAEPQLVGLQCSGDDFRGTPVEPVWLRD